MSTIYQATPKVLTNPSEGEINEVVNVLLEAFSGDPLTPIFTGNSPHLSPLQFKAGIGAAAAGGALHVLVLSSDNEPSGERIVGVAAWFPPGTTVNSSPEQRAAGWDQFMNAASPELRKWWTEYFIPALGTLHSAALPKDFAKEAWHLHLFGVLPEYQGKGFGKKLFRFAEEQARLTSSPIILETATDLDILIYRRLGMSVVEEMKIESEHGQSKMVIMVKKWD